MKALIVVCELPFRCLYVPGAVDGSVCNDGRSCGKFVFFVDE